MVPFPKIAICSVKSQLKNKRYIPKVNLISPKVKFELAKENP